MFYGVWLICMWRDWKLGWEEQVIKWGMRVNRNWLQKTFLGTLKISAIDLLLNKDLQML